MSAISSGKIEDLTSAANAARKVVCDMLKVARLAAQQSKYPAAAERTIGTTRACASGIRALLDFATQPPAPDTKPKALALSRAIAAAVSEVSAAAEALKVLGGGGWEGEGKG